MSAQRKKRFILAYVPRRYEKAIIAYGPHTLGEMQKTRRIEWRRCVSDMLDIYELVRVKL